MYRTLKLMCLLVLFSAAAAAQTTTSCLSGVGSMANGILLNATIVARDNKTNKELTVVASNSNQKLLGTF